MSLTANSDLPVEYNSWLESEVDAYFMRKYISGLIVRDNQYPMCIEYGSMITLIFDGHSHVGSHVFLLWFLLLR